MKKLIVGLTTLALVGCASPGVHEHTFFEGVVPAVDTDLEARSMCSAVSYEADHDRWLTVVRDMRMALAGGDDGRTGSPELEGGSPDPNYPDYTESRRSPNYYGVNDPQVRDALYMVTQFEAELDGSYDAVVQNCRAYNQCMIRNEYDERLCGQTADMWENSQVRFHQLADRMAEVRERVARACSNCGPSYNRRPHHTHSSGHGRTNSGYQNDDRYGPFSGGSN